MQDRKNINLEVMKRKTNTKRRSQQRRPVSKKKLSKFDAGILLFIFGAIIFFGQGFKIPLLILGEEIDLILFIMGKMHYLHITNSTFWKIVGMFLMIFGAIKSIVWYMKFKKSLKKSQAN